MQRQGRYSCHRLGSMWAIESYLEMERPEVWGEHNCSGQGPFLITDGYFTGSSYDGQKPGRDKYLRVCHSWGSPRDLSPKPTPTTTLYHHIGRLGLPKRKSHGAHKPSVPSEGEELDNWRYTDKNQRMPATTRKKQKTKIKIKTKWNKQTNKKHAQEHFSSPSPMLGTWHKAALRTSLKI